jgi:protein-tyrosine phosphatase
MTVSPAVLFVCLGNICRSPTAQAVFAARAKSAALDLIVESAGTGAWHEGEPPDPRSIEAGRGRGYSFTGQTARKVEPLDFARFDYILAMDGQNLRELEALCPQSYGGHLGLFLDFAGKAGADVPDPYYGGERGFETVLDLIERASDGLLKTLKTNAASE